MDKIKWYKREGLHINIDDNGKRVVKLYDVFKSNDGIYYENGYYKINAIVLTKGQYSKSSEFKLHYSYYNEDKKELSRLKLKDTLIGEWNNDYGLKTRCVEEVEKVFIDFARTLAYHLSLKFLIEIARFDTGDVSIIDVT